MILRCSPGERYGAAMNWMRVMGATKYGAPPLGETARNKQMHGIYTTRVFRGYSKYIYEADDVYESVSFRGCVVLVFSVPDQGGGVGG